MYKKYLGHCERIDYVGSIHRNNQHVDRVVTNPYVVDSLSELGWPEEKLTHRLVSANAGASYYSFGKYDRHPRLMNQQSFHKALKMVATAFRCMENSCIIENYEALKLSLEFQSSPGFPWNRVEPRKRILVDDHMFKQYYNDFVCDMSRGFVRVAFWQNIVKWELKPVDKVLANKVRTFTAGPLEMTLLGESLFADQNEKMLRASNFLTVPSTVGYRKFASGWHKLYQQLSKFPNAMAMDISEYDGGLYPQFFDAIRFLRKSWMLPDFQTPYVYNLIDGYYDNVVNSLVVMDLGDVLRKESGNPSGQKCTITDNTIALVLAWCYSWCELMPEDMHTWTSFERNVVLKCCGDDSITTISDDVKHLFNPQSIQEVMSFHLGWKFKISNPTFENLNDTEYCSMYWFFDRFGRVFPKPAIGKVLSSLAYKNLREGRKMVLLRALALRIESWFDFECRFILDTFIRDELDNHLEELYSDNITPIPLEDILQVYKSSYEIDMLYVSGEGASEKALPNKSVLNYQRFGLEYDFIFIQA
jgi:hypothetical protein